MPLVVFAEDIMDGSCGLVNEIMCDQVERLGDFDASQLLYEPIIFQALLMGLEARIVGEELFLESFGEVELIARANLISKAVWKYDLINVNG